MKHLPNMVKHPCLRNLAHLPGFLTCGKDDHLERTSRLCGYLHPEPVKNDIKSLQGLSLSLAGIFE